MSDLPPITQKVQMDTTNYKAGITELNRQIRVVESGFRAAAAGMGEWDKTSAGLESRIESLGKTIALQKDKIAGLQGVYDKLASSGKASTKELQEMQIRINKETETLGKMETELRKSTDALDDMGKEAQGAGDSTKHLADQEERAHKAGVKLGDVMRGLGGALKIGAKAIMGVATAAGAAGAAIGGLVLKASDMAGELVDTANQTGLTVEQLQELKFVGDQIGVSTETITGAMARMIRSMNTARGGTGAQAEAFQKLGVSVTNADGSLRDSQTVFAEAMSALGRMTNETERDALAMELFGKSAMELNPLIKTSADEIDALTAKAHELGAVVAEEDVNALEEFGDTLAGLKAGLQGTMMTLATAFLPAFKGIAGMAEKYLGQFSKIVTGANGDLTKMADGIGGLLGQIATDIAAQGPKMMEAGLGILQGIINAVVSNLPVLLPAAVQVVTSLVNFIVQNLPILVQAGMQIITTLAEGLLPMLPTLLEAGIQVIITLAEGIAEALPKLVPAIVEVIPKIIQTLVENLPLLIDAALQIILALANGLIDSIPILLESIPQLVEALVTALIESAPLLIEAALELILALVTGILENIPVLLGAIGETNQAIAKAFREMDWKKIGTDLLNGIKQGFTEQWSNFVSTITRNLQDLVAKIKKILKIHSPSGVTEEIGEFMALGLGEGFEGAFGKISTRVSQMIGGLGDINLTPNLAGAGAGFNQAPSAGPVYVTVQANVANEIDYYRLAQRVGAELQRGRRA